MNNEVEARRLITLIKQWIWEARMICHEMEDVEKCQEIIEEMFEVVEKLQKVFGGKGE